MNYYEEIKHKIIYSIRWPYSSSEDINLNKLYTKLGEEMFYVKEGGVLEHPESSRLLEFWGKKDVAGIILMPITCHQIVHLSDCIKLKQKIKAKVE